ncbi:hypothetical protein [Pontibacillus litoralis]|uniref:Uncharacterized protein n=1 Tax=Pontibacillus litoralis JSM 072002 TaxID=1385512 RepID=A0A0A5FXN1_9BACI|nr:hypothetical protein [Pontibacillus litoralis]KGX85571.1 hypothetical protein N784_08665 [Pontibacillus litoralis JSM 072002]
MDMVLYVLFTLMILIAVAVKLANRSGSHRNNGFVPYDESEHTQQTDESDDGEEGGGD